MAVGLATLFGFSMPQNFASPYKSRSIVEFWRRWHITLSRFLRDYLYIPLGGNRRGELRQNLNLMITMLLGGFWHGASFNFILWGGLHGIYLLLAHKFRALSKKGFLPGIPAAVAWGMTFFCVMFAWVPFRASDLSSAVNMWRGMLMLNGVKLKDHPVSEINADNLHLLLILMAFCLLLPNTSEIFRDTGALLRTPGYPETEKRALVIRWRPVALWAFGCIILFWISVLKLNDPSEFLYFQF
jgi:alginate O-acetyltransferase complex protein AlgI